MNPKKALFVINNPGGFRAILPVLPLIESYQLFVTEQISSLVPESQSKQTLPYYLTEADILKILEQQKPSVLIVGTSVPSSKGGNLESLFIQAAFKKGIPSISVLDHWCHYQERYTLHKTLDALPQIICIMDTKAKKEMLSLGFPESILSVTGQPAFDSLLSNAKDREQCLTERVNRFPVSSDQKLITFVSEPVAEDYGNKRGYTQHEALEILKFVMESIPNTRIAIKKHPRESNDFFSEFIINNNDFFLSDTAPRDLVLSSDLVIGMTSILLIESAMMGIPTISFQPGISLDSDYAMMIQPIPVISGVNPLKEAITSSSNLNSLTFPYHETNATQKVADQIKQFM